MKTGFDRIENGVWKFITFAVGIVILGVGGVGLLECCLMKDTR